MSTIGEIKVPIDFQITPASRELIKRLIAETLREALEGERLAFLPPEDELRAFIRAEVKTTLADTSRGLHLASDRRRHG